MLYRIVIKMEWVPLGFICLGIIAFFFSEWIFGACALSGGILLHFFLTWLKKKSAPVKKYEADEHGNATPTYL